MISVRGKVGGWSLQNVALSYRENPKVHPSSYSILDSLLKPVFWETASLETGRNSDASLYQIFISCVTWMQHSEILVALPAARHGHLPTSELWFYHLPCLCALLGLSKPSVSHTCCCWAARFWINIKSHCLLLLVIRKTQQDGKVRARHKPCFKRQGKLIRNKVSDHLTHDCLPDTCSFLAWELHPGQHEERNGGDTTERSAEPDRCDDRNRNQPAKSNRRADPEVNWCWSPSK